jgi:pimeloyl-ACP methyl ester carboxylesterase
LNLEEPGPSVLDHERDLENALLAFLSPVRMPLTPRDETLLRRGVSLGLVGGLAATSWGEGPTVLLVHGWNSRGTHWGAYVDALTETGFRVVAVDAPGHGDSPGDRCHVLDYSQRLIEVARQIGPLAGVVGHSFGAGATVLSLDRGLLAQRVALLSGPASLRMVVERWARGHRLAETEIPAFLEQVERVVGKPIDQLDIIRIASGLDQPALIIHDRSDEEVPLGDAVAIAGAWPGARLIVTERYGHRRILIAREVVRQVVTFLAGLPTED